jgi:hydroxymethylpyrimidine pyrophosphatase-like HAD family hydrolase
MHENIYVFDLDGVITNPEDSSVDEVTVKHIFDLLYDGLHVAINTGRSFEWVNNNLISMLRKLGSHEHFDRLYIVCEKGGESLLWQNDNFIPQPSRFALSTSNIKACKELFKSVVQDYSTMFWDSTKNTMATIEKLPESNLEEFHTQQKLLADRLQAKFADQDIKIDPTTIATDVESPLAGKHAGAELIYEWLSERLELQDASFICFGDSVSDYEMARYFASQNKNVTFVFVGKKENDISEHDGVKLIRTNALYSLGTREYFKVL